MWRLKKLKAEWWLAQNDEWGWGRGLREKLINES
jgi:hypothetical protein